MNSTSPPAARSIAYPCLDDLIAFIKSSDNALVWRIDVRKAFEHTKLRVSPTKTPRPANTHTLGLPTGTSDTIVVDKEAVVEIVD